MTRGVLPVLATIERGAYLAVPSDGVGRWIRVRSAKRSVPGIYGAGDWWTCDVVIGGRRGVYARTPVVLSDTFLKTNARTPAEVADLGWPGPGTLPALVD